MPDATPPLTAPGVVAGLLADVAERDERLADLRRAADTYRDGMADIAAQRDGLQALIDAGQPALATELLAARADLADAVAQLGRMRHESWAKVVADRDDARSAFATLAGRFTQGAQSGWTARISGTVLRRLCAMAGCEPPPGSDAPDEASELRAIIAEIIDWFWDPDPEMPGDAADARVDEWRQRAGLDAP